MRVNKLYRAYDRHIARLCKEHEIKRIVKPGRGHARVNWRVIRHPPILEEMAYFVALHEIGHVLTGLKGTRLEREALCWQYALDEALVEPHYSTRQRICALLVRYIARAQENGWKMPEKGDLYWELMNWWTPLPAPADPPANEAKEANPDPLRGRHAAAS